MIDIEINGLTKRFGTVTALNNINLSIKGGELFFLLGPSGCGKTTLLRSIAGFYKPDEGCIIFGKKDITEVPTHKRKVGMVFQNYALWPHMTVFQNVELVMRVVGASSRAIRKRVPYVLSLFSMEDKADRYPRELSGGEKQRVGLARALVNNPNLIIADEPTGNIDPSMSYEIMDLLAQINKRGTTVLVVTHDMSVASKFDFRTIEINKGNITSDTSSKSKVNVQNFLN